MSITAKHVWGKALEERLSPVIGDFLECDLTPTAWRYDSVDFNTSLPGGDVAELKGRPKDRNNNPNTPQDVESFDHWYFPCSKCLSLKKPLHIFYYWERSNRLFYLLFDIEKFVHYRTGVPPNHPTNQLHYLIPREDFVELEKTDGSSF
jgi:hypothetical protein